MKSYKIEIRLNKDQKEKYIKTVGTCRYVYNLFIDINKQRYEKGESYLNNYKFSKWINNEYIENNPGYSWIKEVSSKSIRYVIDNADKSFKKMFKKEWGYPKYKKRDKNDCTMYFVKTDARSIIKHERHKIKIPTLGWVYLKEYGYLPKNVIIKSGVISKKANRFYISLNTDEDYKIEENNKKEGIGIDIGIKDFAICSNSKVYKNINKTKKINKIEKQLRRQCRCLSRKIENNKKGGKAAYKNITKQKVRIQKIYQKLNNIRTDYQNKVIVDIIKQEPSFITIEDLNVKGIMKNKHLSKSVSNQSFNSFINKLMFKCKLNSIELRQVNRFYPSSKTCSNCGFIKDKLKLNERTYKCECCGYIINRDFNASINLKNSKDYTIIA